MNGFDYHMAHQLRNIRWWWRDIIRSGYKYLGGAVAVGVVSIYFLIKKLVQPFNGILVNYHVLLPGEIQYEIICITVADSLVTVL